LLFLEKASTWTPGKPHLNVLQPPATPTPKKMLLEAVHGSRSCYRSSMETAVFLSRHNQLRGQWFLKNAA
jgi:hypothetical protein